MAFETAGAIAVGALGGYLAQGLKTATAQLWGFYRRLELMRHVLRNESLIPKPLHLAIRDIETVFGSVGLYTTQLDGFFKELGSSGVFSHMAEGILLNTNSRAAEIAFCELYSLHFGDELLSFSGQKLNGMDLYRRIEDMMRIDLWREDLKKLSIPKTRQLQTYIDLELVKSSRQEFNGKEAIVLKSFRPAAETDQIEDNEDWHLARQTVVRVLPELLRGLTTAYSSIWVPEPDRRSRTVPLTNIFVESSVMQDLTANALNGGYDKSHVGQSLSFQEFADSLSRSVLLGDPGGGKSTIGQELCGRIMSRFAQGKGKIPIRITLRNFESAREADPQLPMLTYIARELVRVCHLKEGDELRAAVKYFLSFGQVNLFFDGLDEIIKLSKRRDYVAEVVSFTSLFPLCPTLITSRIIGYDQAPLPNGFSVHYLESFNDNSIREFVAKYAIHVFGRTASEAVVAADDILDRTKNDAPDLINNALLLALMVWLYFDRSDDLPNNRAAIYRECSTLMFQRWDEERRITRDIPADFDLLNLLAALAPKFYLDARFVGGVSRSWLVAAVRDHFVTEYGQAQDMRSKIAAERVVSFITGRAWILTDRGPNRYEFDHRTFLEYFFGRYLDDRYETLNDFLEEVLPHINRGEWVVPSHLAMQRKLEGRPSRALEAAGRLLAEISGAALTEAGALPSFVAETLEYLQPPDPLVESLAE